MNTQTHGRSGGGSDSLRKPSFKERVAMASSWHTADLIPDRVYSLMGKLVAYYWESSILTSEYRLGTLREIVTRLGTLAQVRAIDPDVAFQVANSHLGMCFIRGYPVPPDARADLEKWLKEGFAGGLKIILREADEFGDPKHRPSPPRPLCHHCGAVQ